MVEKIVSSLIVLGVLCVCVYPISDRIVVSLVSGTEFAFKKVIVFSSRSLNKCVYFNARIVHSRFTRSARAETKTYKSRKTVREL